jgi:thymidylate synthase (FAD)
VSQFTTKVLDHGFVTLRNLAGPTRRTMNKGLTLWREDRPFDADDTDVANAARMSFDNADGDRSYEVEMKLNKYLMSHEHMSPFEMIQVWLEMKLPIFLARQFVRHRTAKISEVSGRYVQLPAEWYIPEVVGGKPAGGAKQGQSDTLDEETQDWFRVQLDAVSACAYEDYETALARGVAPEHARLLLGLNHFTHWLYGMDLRNLFHFLALRCAKGAQVEAQAYGNAIVGLLEPQLPGLMGLWRELQA